MLLNVYDFFSARMCSVWGSVTLISFIETLLVLLLQYNVLKIFV